MVQVRSGEHGNIGYVFEGDGLNTAPTDTTVKGFGADAVMDTFDAGYQAERKYNATRKAAEIIEQNFDGGWGVSFDLGAFVPWWLAGVYGQPTSTETATTGLYDHVYSVSDDPAVCEEPTPLRLYAPTDGFNDYKVVPGCWIVSVSIDQSEDGNPEVSLSGGYAAEPFEQSSPSISIPDFGERSFTNRDAELQIDGQTVGKAQTSTVDLETNTEGVSEIGTGSAVDLVPGAFEPDLTHDKIVWVNQDVNNFDRWKNANQVTGSLSWDNGATGTDEYTVGIDVTDMYPDQWSESGRNDPDANLTEELQEMGQDATVTVTVDTQTPPGA